MSRHLLVLMLIHFSISSFGQMSFGLKAGFNVNDLRVKNKPNGFEYNPKPNIGYHFGVYGFIKLGKRMSFIPEVQFSQRGYEYNHYKMKLNYLELPLLLSYSPIHCIGIDVGPSLGYKISAISTENGSTNNIDFIYHRHLDFWHYRRSTI